MKPIIRKGHLGGDEQIVPILAHDIRQSLDLMEKEGIKYLAINNAWGWDPMKKNLDFLLDNPWVEGVMIVSENVDISALNALHHLKRLALPDKYTGVLDFNNFPQLEVLFCRWNKKQLKNIGGANNLEWVSINWINETDLSIFRDYRKLKRFDSTYSKIHSLHGIEHWDSLERLGLLNVPKLADITALECLAGHLKMVGIEGCKSLQDYSPLEKLKVLEGIWLNGGPAISSVSFVQDKPITEGYIGLEILDRKFEILEQKGIRYHKFKSYKS